jgi:2-polyprenyl-3-methyl-5-hydroxy-6-metoxy-1,4-benzoquinol methylase
MSVQILSSEDQFLDSTLYYDENAQNYFETTVGHDVSALYDLFLPFLVPKAKILDAGCGSGRDSKFFLTQGYAVTAFDGSQKMAELARQHTGLPVAHKTFSDVNEEEEFDAIWAGASLLHVPKLFLPRILHKLKAALKPQGVWYMSFRHGETELNEGDRYFNDQTEDSLRKMLEQLGGLEIIHMSIPDVSSRRGYKFVSCIVRKI